MYVGSVTPYQETLQTVLSYTIDYFLQLARKLPKQRYGISLPMYFKLRGSLNSFTK
jgi:hypothetical protein